LLKGLVVFCLAKERIDQLAIYFSSKNKFMLTKEQIERMDLDLEEPIAEGKAIYGLNIDSCP
jgi:hypothetical protein